MNKNTQSYFIKALIKVHLTSSCPVHRQSGLVAPYLIAVRSQSPSAQRQFPSSFESTFLHHLQHIESVPKIPVGLNRVDAAELERRHRAER